MRLSGLILGCLAVPLYGQLNFYVVASGAEQLVDGAYSLGTANTGDTLNQRFRLKNAGNVSAPVSILSIQGDGFVLQDVPRLPQTLASGQFVEFTVVFHAGDTGSYSANLQADHSSVIVQAAVVPSVSVFVEENGGQRLLAGGSTVDFGSVERDSIAARRFTLINQTRLVLLPVPALTGAGFVLNAPQPSQLSPGDSTTFVVNVRESQVGQFSGTLQIDRRQIAVKATVVEPALPRGSILLNLPNPASGQQGTVTIQLASASRGSGTGKLSVDFRPATPNNDDPAVLFPLTGSRSIPLTVSPGDTSAHFGTLTGIEFQTGTTAGTLLFTLELGANTDQAAVTLAAAAIHIDAASATHTASGIQVSVRGFDNTRTAGNLSFTFYDRGGGVLAPGKIPVDAATAFGKYFTGSTVGGLFALQAVFPATGSDQIDSVDVQLANSIATAASNRIKIN